MSSWKTYGKIKKLLTSKNIDDKTIGIELLLANSQELTPDQFYYLNSVYGGYFRHTAVTVGELQRHLYDKRKQEKQIVRKNTKVNRK